MATALALVGACSSGPVGTTIVTNTPQTVGLGDQRLLLVVVDDQQNFLGGPDTPATVSFSRDGSTKGTSDAEWIWGIEGVRGFYATHFDFDTPGDWSAKVTLAGKDATSSLFTVTSTVVVPEVGTAAPRSVTLTAEDRPMKDLTTDPSPDPAFYAMTVADAVTSGRPSVIIFATPAFCQTALCGPVVDVAKSVAAEHPGVTFVHVEPYDVPKALEGDLENIPAVEEWGLPTEPWVFVIDADGNVAARFEGTVGAGELGRAITAVGG
jgi:hypothetical protein